MAAPVGVDAVLSQRSYFAGDVVRCRVYFYFSRGASSGRQQQHKQQRGAANHSAPAPLPPDAKKQHGVAQGNAAPPEDERVLLEWATAQVHGHVAFDPHLVSPRDAADVASEAHAGFDPDDRARRLRQAQDSGVLHRAEHSLRVLRKTTSSVQVGRARMTEDSRTSSFSDVNLASLDGYDDSREFLSGAYTMVSQSMPDVTLMAGKFGSCLFVSPPEVLTCAHHGRPGTEVAFAFEATLPAALPPSYKGSAARYFYVLTIGCKLGHMEKASVMHVPIRICSSLGEPWAEAGRLTEVRAANMRSFSSFLLEEHNFHVRSWALGELEFHRSSATGGSGGSHREDRFRGASSDLPLSINPKNGRFRVVDFDSTGFREREKGGEEGGGAGEPVRRRTASSASEASLDDTGPRRRRLSSTGSCSSSNDDGGAKRRWRAHAGSHGCQLDVGGEQIFRIGSESRHMAQLHMFKRAVAPGDEVLLCFDFSDAVVPCYQVTVALEIEERSKCPPPLQAVLDPLTAADPSQRRAVSPRAGNNSQDLFGAGPWTRVILSRTVQVVFNAVRAITLTIPVDASPDFETDLISVRSYLRFEFVTQRREADGGPAAGRGGPALPISTNDTQTCPWRVPLRVVPPRGQAERKQSQEDQGILLLSSSTQSSMLHARLWI